jgi:hypothetical protein
MYTVTADYSAADEGRTMLVLYTQGQAWGPHSNDPARDGRYWALETFREKFGEWFAMHAQIHDGIVFDFPDADLLISPALQALLGTHASLNVGLEYHAALHI